MRINDFFRYNIYLNYNGVLINHLIFCDAELSVLLAAFKTNSECFRLCSVWPHITVYKMKSRTAASLNITRGSSLYPGGSQTLWLRNPS